MARATSRNLDEIAGESPADLRNWYATHCLNGERQILKPWEWDIVKVNRELALLNC